MYKKNINQYSEIHMSSVSKKVKDLVLLMSQVEKPCSASVE